MQQNYVTIYEEYKHKFYQLPKVFFTNPKYMGLSSNAKIAWSILRDRSSLSRKNKWYDTDTGRIYFIFRNEDLMKLLNLKGKATLVKVKKELEDAGLIESKRLGLNKPNKLYLLYPEIREDDVYAIDEQESYEYSVSDDDKPVTEKSPEQQGTSENKVPEGIAKPLVPQGSSKNELPEKEAESLMPQGSSKNELQEVQKMNSINTECSETEKVIDTLDTSDTKTAPFDDEREKRKNALMDKAFYENSLKIPERLAEVLKIFSKNPEHAKKLYSVILTAKKNAEKDTGHLIWLEEQSDSFIEELINSLARSIRKIEKDRTVKNKDGYLYKSIYDMIVNDIAAKQRQEARENLFNDDGPLYDWLNDE